MLKYTNLEKTAAQFNGAFFSLATPENFTSIGDGPTREQVLAWLAEGNVPEDFIPPEPIPVILSCSPWQMRKKLNKEGLRQTVEDYVVLPDTPIEIKDGWLYATEFREDDPFVQQMATMLQVENLHAFIEDALTL